MNIVDVSVPYCFIICSTVMNENVEEIINLTTAGPLEISKPVNLSVWFNCFKHITLHAIHKICLPYFYVIVFVRCFLQKKKVNIFNHTYTNSRIFNQ